MVVEGKERGTALLSLFHSDGGFTGSRLGGGGSLLHRGCKGDRAATNKKGSEQSHHAESSRISARPAWTVKPSTAILHTKGERNDPPTTTDWTVTEPGPRSQSSPH